MTKAKVLLAVLLFSAQTLALAHGHEHEQGPSHELCDVCVLGQGLDDGVEAPQAESGHWVAQRSSRHSAGSSFIPASPVLFLTRGPPCRS